MTILGRVHVERSKSLDAPDPACPSCGGELREMKDQFETSEMIDVVEVSYRLVQVKQQKYVCRCGGCVETALGPDRAVPGSRYSLALAVKVLIDKYLDHISLERRCRIVARQDGSLLLGFTCVSVAPVLSWDGPQPALTELETQQSTRLMSTVTTIPIACASKVVKSDLIPRSGRVASP